MPTLPLRDLALRHPGLTDAVARCYVEAAGVCLDRHFESPIEIEIQAPRHTVQADVQWQRASTQIAGAWANDIDATEFGAYGMAIAAVELTEGLLTVRRAETRSGADYYVAPVGTQTDDLENWQRLEVSGIDQSDSATIAQRARRKAQQTIDGASNLPAIIAVVGFRSKCIAVAAVAGNP